PPASPALEQQLACSCMKEPFPATMPSGGGTGLQAAAQDACRECSKTSTRRRGNLFPAREYNHLGRAWRTGGGDVNEDLEGIRRTLAGDTEAFRLLVVRYQRPLFGFIRNLVGGTESEDVAQDVFLAAFANLASFDPARATFSTWLFTIARNRCLAALKK